MKQPWCLPYAVHSVPNGKAPISSLTSMFAYFFHALLVYGPAFKSTSECTKSTILFLSFLFLLQSLDVAPAQQLAPQTMRVYPFNMQFPVLHPSITWTNKRNSLSELSAWLLQKGRKQILLFLTRVALITATRDCPIPGEL